MIIWISCFPRYSSYLIRLRGQTQTVTTARGRWINWDRQTNHQTLSPQCLSLQGRVGGGSVHHLGDDVGVVSPGVERNVVIVVKSCYGDGPLCSSEGKYYSLSLEVCNDINSKQVAVLDLTRGDYLVLAPKYLPHFSFKRPPKICPLGHK